VGQGTYESGLEGPVKDIRKDVFPVIRRARREEPLDKVELGGDVIHEGDVEAPEELFKGIGLYVGAN
jgi:hypothetical protein